MLPFLLLGLVALQDGALTGELVRLAQLAQLAQFRNRNPITISQAGNNGKVLALLSGVRSDHMMLTCSKTRISNSEPNTNMNICLS